MSFNRASGSHPPAGQLSKPASRKLLSRVWPAAYNGAIRSGGESSHKKKVPFFPSGSFTTRGARFRMFWSSRSNQSSGGSIMCESASKILIAFSIHTSKSLSGHDTSQLLRPMAVKDQTITRASPRAARLVVSWATAQVLKGVRRNTRDSYEHHDTRRLSEDGENARC